MQLSNQHLYQSMTQPCGLLYSHSVVNNVNDKLPHHSLHHTHWLTSRQSQVYSEERNLCTTTFSVEHRICCTLLSSRVAVIRSSSSFFSYFFKRRCIKVGSEHKRHLTSRKVTSLDASGDDSEDNDETHPKTHANDHSDEEESASSVRVLDAALLITRFHQLTSLSRDISSQSRHSSALELDLDAIVNIEIAI